MVRLVAGVLLAVLLAGCGSAASGSTGCAVLAPDPPGAAESGRPVQPLCALPPEAAATFDALAAGDELPYEQDGATFGNREGLLPEQARGFYREYTVPTPGEDDRGARRLVTGGEVGPDLQVFYTADHYESFVVVDVTAR